MMYIKMIIIPPKKARVKIRGIHGFDLSIHLIIILMEENVRIEISIIMGVILIMYSIDLRIIIFNNVIQNLVYLKF